ncbi:LL-diaminopimelate aminotransferase [Candidatus Lokiarchaeum ossiferum]|uniref:LL-diaminopimelate aminotransferase n=1 Tax=Candidatus Lokiarchaeum ossiferum TaxID=2951803 RepID=A0ABY6HLD2_9ARCH|nr:LL-diaminopimelate aminotransferase [Candidatus Lokiarchaeum sp. B-35]
MLISQKVICDSMTKPIMSDHFIDRKPSDIRAAQIEFAKRTDNVKAINVAIGNVSLPMHPALFKRMSNLADDSSPFNKGVLKYTATVGMKETNQAILNIIAASNFKVDNLYSQITDGGSHAMELVIIGTCGAAGTSEKPLMLIDAAYTNYLSMAKRTGRATVSISRKLQENGKFALPDISEIEKMIETEKPGALVVIPYDNPTGHFYDHQTMIELGKLCVKYNLWMISDEAYRELYYVDTQTSSIWGLTNDNVPGIEGRRISIETASKVWNACGLRIGALVTDNYEFHEKCVFEQTANLCAPAIAQYIMGGLAHETKEDLQAWFLKQRTYYKEIGQALIEEFHEWVPSGIISSPDASLYSVIDVRNIAKPGFDSSDFVKYCTKTGKVEIDGTEYTLLVAPMSGFYKVKEGQPNPGKTQMRVAYVETLEKMRLIPELFANLFNQFESQRT